MDPRAIIECNTATILKEAVTDEQTGELIQEKEQQVLENLKEFQTTFESIFSQIKDRIAEVYLVPEKYIAFFKAAQPKIAEAYSNSSPKDMYNTQYYINCLLEIGEELDMPEGIHNELVFSLPAFTIYNPALLPLCIKKTFDEKLQKMKYIATRIIEMSWNQDETQQSKILEIIKVPYIPAEATKEEIADMLEEYLNKAAQYTQMPLDTQTHRK